MFQVAIPGILSLRFGLYLNGQIHSPSHTEFQWGIGVLKSECPKCGSGNPSADCTCGIYSITSRHGLGVLSGYWSPNAVCFIGQALGKNVVYEDGLRSGWWVARGVVEFYGNATGYDLSRSMSVAREVVRIYQKEWSPEFNLYPLEVAMQAIEIQKTLSPEYVNLLNRKEFQNVTQ